MSVNGGEQSPLLTTYTEVFDEAFPQYLMYGMTYQQYWEDDPSICQFYRKADELKSKRLNQTLWLQGLYIYEALCDVSPVLHAFAKSGVKPIPYSQEPYPLDDKQMKEQQDERDKKVAEKGKRLIESLMNKSSKGKMNG